MANVPDEYRIAIALFEDCFGDYFRNFRVFDDFTDEKIGALITGFIMGRGWNWRHVKFSEVRRILYNMACESRPVPEDDDFRWIMHLRSVFKPNA